MTATGNMWNSDQRQDDSEEDTKALVVTLSIQGSENDLPHRRKYILETTLQTWASTHGNTAKGRLTCEVLDVSKDGRDVQLSIRPPPDLSELVALEGRMLPRKDGKMLRVTSVSWAGASAQTPWDGVMKAPPPLLSDPQHERAPAKENGCTGPPAAVFMAGNEFYVLPADAFLALSYGCSEEVRCIEKRNNCVMKAKVKVEFVKGDGQGHPQKALSEFKALAQGSLGPAPGSVVPPRRLHPEEMDMRTRITKPEEGVQPAQSSLEQHQPSQSKERVDTFRSCARSLDLPEASSSAPQQTAADVKMDIDGSLFSGGITIEERCWTQLTMLYHKQLVKVQEKFNVRLKEEHVGQGRVRIRLLGRNAALESHAARAIVDLCQRTVASPFTSHRPVSATGFTKPDPLKNTPQRDRGQPLVNGQSGAGAVPKTATVGAAAGGGDRKGEPCPICFDTCKDRRQLGCKHEFCRGCLESSVNFLGPCCPVCKHVFGTMVGNQPDGTMTSRTIPQSLPGFPNCDTIAICYNIPSGMQTENHPHPGVPFNGSNRTAYLPNNREGKEVLQLLKKAFDQRLIFTIGQSRTTGADNQVTWNDIHHKTSTRGGPTEFGYPDPDYLGRVRNELKAKGIQ